MKKTLSIFMALIMLVSTMSVATFNAYAYSNKNDAPKVELGQTFSITYKNDKVITEDELMDDDFEIPLEYFAKFVPTKTGYYEFEFSNGMTPKAPQEGMDYAGSAAMVFVVDKSEQICGLTMWFGIEDDSLFVACEMTKGKSYYLGMYGEQFEEYHADVTLKNHEHKLVKTTNAAFSYSGYYEDGDVSNECVCGYSKKLSTIPYAKTVSLSTTSYTYNGSAKKPKVTVKDRKGNVISSSNYTVTYSNNKKVGTAKVIVEFNDKKYSGELVKTFKINPKGTKLSSVTAKSKGFAVKWNRQSDQTTGYQLQYATDKNFSKNKKTVTITGVRNVSRTITGLKGKTKYYVRVRTFKTVNKTKYYSSWSSAKTVTTKK